MNKKVRNFVKEHRDIPRTSRQKDLSKFYEAEASDNFLQDVECRSGGDKPVWKYACVWSIVAVVVVMAIVLPVALTGRDNAGQQSPQQLESPEQVLYCDSAEIQYIPIESLSAFNDKYQSDVRINTEVMAAVTHEIYSEEFDKVIGVKTDLYIYDDRYQEASVLGYIEEYRIASGQYAVFEKTDKTADISIDYSVVPNGGVYAYHLHWDADGIGYYASVIAYAQVDIREVLNCVFLPA